MLVAEYRKTQTTCTWGVTDYTTGLFYPFGTQESCQSIIDNINKGMDKISGYGTIDLFIPYAYPLQPTIVVDNSINITINTSPKGRKFKDFDNEPKPVL
jgi:hypothetical protein